MKLTAQSVWSVLVVLLASPVLAQTTTDANSSSDSVPANQWSFSLATSGYLVPHDQSYVSPTFTADHRWLHLEARYNYEYQRTGSLWAGYNFSVGDKLAARSDADGGRCFWEYNWDRARLQYLSHLQAS